jgi:glucose-1-phosphate thymidylyltransferase
MNVIVLAAGLGSRLMPHTRYRPKPLLHVGGDVMLSHVLRRLGALDIDTLVLVVGHLGDQIVSYVRAHYAGRVAVVDQSPLLGQSHAVKCAARWLSGPILIVLPDMVFDADLEDLGSVTADGVVYSQVVADPSRFGVVIVDGKGIAVRFVEKPRSPVSDRAIVGVYYVKDGSQLLRVIDCQLATGDAQAGEYYLAGALQAMVDEGARLEVRTVAAWADCGTKDDLLAANRFLLQRLGHDVPCECGRDNVVRPPVRIHPSATVAGSVIGPYVFVGPKARLWGSVVGPHVSLAGGATIRGSVVADAVLEWGASVADAAVVGGLLGRMSEVRCAGGRFDLGDGDAVVGSGQRHGAPSDVDRPGDGRSDTSGHCTGG